jgi:hypothetical protein
MQKSEAVLDAGSGTPGRERFHKRRARRRQPDARCWIHAKARGFQRGQRYAGGTVLPARRLKWRSAMFRPGLRPKRPGPDPDRDRVTFPSVPRLRVQSRAGAQAGCNESLAFLGLGFDSGCVESWKTARQRRRMRPTSCCRAWMSVHPPRRVPTATGDRGCRLIAAVRSGFCSRLHVGRGLLGR